MKDQKKYVFEDNKPPPHPQSPQVKGSRNTPDTNFEMAIYCLRNFKKAHSIETWKDYCPF